MYDFSLSLSSINEQAPISQRTPRRLQTHNKCHLTEKSAIDVLNSTDKIVIEDQTTEKKLSGRYNRQNYYKNFAARTLNINTPNNITKTR